MLISVSQRFRAVYLFLLVTLYLTSCGLCETSITEAKNISSRSPYIVSLRSTRGFHICTGVLVGNRTVITAANCVDDRLSLRATARPTVWVGAFRKDVAKGPLVSVRQTVATELHPKWIGNPRAGYDIAVLKLDEPVPNHRPIRFPPPKVSETLLQSVKQFVFLGYGRGSRSGAFMPSLQKGLLDVLPNKECNKQKERNFKVVDEMLCAGGTASPCAGDAGGPLFFERGNPNTATLIGLASVLNPSCDFVPFPVFTYVGNQEIHDFVTEKRAEFEADEDT